VGGQSDFLAKLAQHRVARVLVLAPAAAGQAPARRIAQLDQDRLAVRSESERVGAERAWPAHSPNHLQQPVNAGKQNAQGGVEDALHEG